MYRVLVFGITGFLGRAFQKYVDDHKLRDVATFIGTGVESHGPSGWGYHQLTVSNRNTLWRILDSEKPTHILNLIGMFDADDEAALRLVNTDFSQTLCEQVLASGLPVRAMVFVGSAAEYGNPEHLPITENTPLRPVSAYGRSKVLQTKLLQGFARRSLPCCIARPFNIVGEGMSTDLSIGAFASRIRAAKRGGTIETGDVSTKRDFLDAADVADAFWKLLFKGKPGESYNVCSGISRTMRSIIDVMIDASGKLLSIREVPDERSRQDVADSVGNPAKLQHATGWRPTHDVLASIQALVRDSG